MAEQSIFKVIFHNQGKVYEIYAQGVTQSNMFGFIEVEQFIFGERSSVVVDPSEEKLKLEFEGVKRAYIPLNAIIRIDEVDKEGTNKILPSAAESSVTPFPTSIFTPQKDST